MTLSDVARASLLDRDSKADQETRAGQMELELSEGQASPYDLTSEWT